MFFSERARIFALEQKKEVMESTVFTPVQQHLLTMFAFDGSEERLKEVKRVLFEYFSKDLDEKLDELWDAGILDQEKLDSLRTKHIRTEVLER